MAEPLTGLVAGSNRSVLSRLRGVCPVLEVPFTPAGEVDEDGFRRVVRHVLQTGVSAVMFPGFASEYHKLDDSERERLTALLLELTRPSDVAAIISIPDHATAVALRRVRAAVAAGADAVNILPPHFLSPPPGQVVDHVEALLESVPDTPAILQYAPAQTGTALDAARLHDLASTHDNFRLVKVESVPPGPVVSALSDGGLLACLVGYAGLHLPDALRRGAVGVQPGCSFVEIYVEIWQRWQAGRVDEANELHCRLLPYLSAWMQNVELIVQVEKTISLRRGLLAHDHCRAPGRRLDSYESATIDRFFDEFGSYLA